MASDSLLIQYVCAGNPEVLEVVLAAKFAAASPQEFPTDRIVEFPVHIWNE